VALSRVTAMRWPMNAYVRCCCVLLLLVVPACGGDGGGDAIDAKGTLAFVSGVQRGSAIFITSADGTERRQLTRQRSRYDVVGDIAWSLDGSRIAYSGGFRNDAAYDDLYVIRVAGGRARRLTRSGDDDWKPQWSPDGRKIAFDLQSDGFNWIYVVNADGSGLRRLTPNFNWYPVWSPDGRIAFANQRGVWVMNADGSQKRLLARISMGISGYEDESPIAWSPDGTQIAFTARSGMWVMDANGQRRRRLSGVDPAWSPDGKMLAWTYADDGDFEIFVGNADGSEARNLTDNERIEDRQPQWSPDGRALAFVREQDGKTDIYVMNADGSGERNVSRTPAEDWSPAWSPTTIAR
jgi:TolB protein